MMALFDHIASALGPAIEFVGLFLAFLWIILTVGEIGMRRRACRTGRRP